MDLGLIPKRLQSHDPDAVCVLCILSVGRGDDAQEKRCSQTQSFTVQNESGLVSSDDRVFHWASCDVEFWREYTALRTAAWCCKSYPSGKLQARLVFTTS